MPARIRRIITVLACALLVVITLVTFQEQIPTISQTTKIYDREYISTLKKIEGLIPPNETLATSENYPQVSYFTHHKVKVPWVDNERSLVEFMWKFNCSYLLVPEDISEPKPDNTPLLIKLAEKPFEKVFEPKHYNTPLKLHKISKNTLFGMLFEKINDYNTEGSILHLYRLRTNITSDNLSIVTDGTKPIVFVSFPANGTIIEKESDVLRLNVTGTAIDEDSKIKQVEISVEGLVFQLANPSAPDDWSTWSFSYIVSSEGTKRILVRATDDADNKRWFPVYITIK